MDEVARRLDFLWQGTIMNLVHWMTWPVVVLAGVAFVFIRHWSVPLIAGVLVVTLTELYFVAPIRAAFAPVGFVGPRTLGFWDVLPGFVVGVVFTVAVQRATILFSGLVVRFGEDWKSR